MNKPIVDTWYKINKKTISNELLEFHKKNLSIESFLLNYITEKKNSPTICFIETEKEFFCPYYYGIKNFGEDFEDNRNQGEIIKNRILEFKSTLDEEILKQKSACISLLKSLNSICGTGLLALPPGSGKTRCACFIWNELCKENNGIIPALVLVHKDFLIDQWKERINELIPEAKIGLLKSKEVDYKEKDIVLCTIQSLINEVKDKKSGLLKNRYSKEIMKYFGFLIIDEAHHIFFFINIILFNI